MNSGVQIAMKIKLNEVKVGCGRGKEADGACMDSVKDKIGEGYYENLRRLTVQPGMQESQLHRWSNGE